MTGGTSQQSANGSGDDEGRLAIGGGAQTWGPTYLVLLIIIYHAHAAYIVLERLFHTYIFKINIQIGLKIIKACKSIEEASYLYIS